MSLDNCIFTKYGAVGLNEHQLELYYGR